MRTCSIVVILSCMALLLAAPAAHGGIADPATAATQLAFGVKMAQRGLWNEALFRFQQADRLSPNSGRIHNNIAVCYEGLGLFDKALEHYQRAIELEGVNPELRKNYSRFVEFYRNFKPEEPPPAAAATDDEDETDDEADADTGTEAGAAEADGAASTGGAVPDAA